MTYEERFAEDMEDKEIRELLRSEPSLRRRGWRCPSDNQVVAYVTGELDERKRKAFETHAADCALCRSAVAFLTQAADWEAPVAAPAKLLARVQGLIGESRPAKASWRWALASAAAACIVLFVAFVVLRFRGDETRTPSGPLVAQQHQPTVPVPQSTPTIQAPRPVSSGSLEKRKSTDAPAPTLRNGAGELKPALVAPREGAVLKRDQLQFRWQPMAGAISYKVTVVTTEGDLVSEATTSDTQVRLSDITQLKPGAKYFVTVIAHLPDGRTARSDVVSFRLANQ